MERRDDLHASEPSARHYTLNPNTGEIRFGDGKHGGIPRPPRGSGPEPTATAVGRAAMSRKD